MALAGTQQSEANQIFPFERPADGARAQFLKVWILMIDSQQQPAGFRMKGDYACKGNRVRSAKGPSDYKLYECAPGLFNTTC